MLKKKLKVALHLVHSNSFFQKIFLNFSIGGWWGQPMSLFWKLVDETQMAAPWEYTDAFIIIKKLFLGGLWGLQSNSIWYERPCRNHTKIELAYKYQSIQNINFLHWHRNNNCPVINIKISSSALNNISIDSCQIHIRPDP